MKPINQKERRLSIWAFIAIFVLAFLPLALAIFLFTRTDTVELGFLRKSYEVQRDEQRVTESYIDKMNNLDKEILDFEDHVVTSSGNKEFRKGDMDSHYRKIQSASSSFVPHSARADSLYSKTAEHLHTISRGLIDLVEHYKNLSDENREKLVEANKTIDLLRSNQASD